MPKATLITKDLEQEIIQFYTENTARATTKHFHIRLDRLNQLLELNQIEKHDTVKTKPEETKETK